MWTICEQSAILGVIARLFCTERVRQKAMKSLENFRYAEAGVHSVHAAHAHQKSLRWSHVLRQPDGAKGKMRGRPPFSHATFRRTEPHQQRRK